MVENKGKEEQKVLSNQPSANNSSSLPSSMISSTIDPELEKRISDMAFVLKRKGYASDMREATEKAKKLVLQSKAELNREQTVQVTHTISAIMTNDPVSVKEMQMVDSFFAEHLVVPGGSADSSPRSMVMNAEEEVSETDINSILSEMDQEMKEYGASHPQQPSHSEVLTSANAATIASVAPEEVNVLNEFFEEVEQAVKPQDTQEQPQEIQESSQMDLPDDLEHPK